MPSSMWGAKWVLGKPARIWQLLLGLAYALVGYAAVLAWTTPANRVMTAQDAVGAAVTGIIVLGLIPLAWERNRHGSTRFAHAQARWGWSLSTTMMGAASGILLNALFHSPNNMLLPWMAAALYGLTAAVTEEWFFRGHLQVRLGWWQVPLFAILHGPATFPIALMAGILFTLLSRQGLGASTAAHAAFNLAATV